MDKSWWKHTQLLLQVNMKTLTIIATQPCYSVCSTTFCVHNYARYTVVWSLEVCKTCAAHYFFVAFSVLCHVLVCTTRPGTQLLITWSVQNNYLVCYALLCCSSSRLDWNVQPRPHNSWYTSKLLIAYVFQQTEFSVHFLLSLIFSYQEWQTQRSYLYKTPRALCN